MTMSHSSIASFGFIKSITIRLLCLLLVLLTQACAHITAPDGGPKDETPPKLMTTSPAQGSINFQGKVINLTFDKAIEVNNIKDRLVITPKLEKSANKPSYTHSIYGKTLRIKLNASLNQATTYTFNFNNAIRDITEGNEAEAPTLIFSTGEQIDTMYIKGNVRNHMTQQPAPGVLVGLYKAGEQRPNYLEDLPDYFTKTDEKGAYHLAHISKGKYYICANNNSALKIDPAVDIYGFLTAPIDLTTTSAEEVLLSVLKADIRAPKIESQQIVGAYFELRFNKAMENYSLTLPQKLITSVEPKVYSHWIEDDQTIRIYNTFGLLEEDSIDVQLTAQDALGQTLEALITLQFSEERPKDDFAYNLEPGSASAIDSNFVATITCNKPIKSVAVDHFCFLANGKEVMQFSDDDWQLNEQRNVLTLKKQLGPSLSALLSAVEVGSTPRQEDKVQAREGLALQLKEGALVSIEKDESQAQVYTYLTKDSEAYGMIQGTVSTQAPGFIVQLLDEDYEVIQEVRNRQHYQFDEIVPGNYRIRVLVLKNADGAWDHGNILTNKAPDAVIFYKATEAITVLPSWPMENVDLAF